MLRLNGLGQIAVHVSDVSVATAFYRDVLGLPFLFAAGPNLSFFSVGDVRLMLGRTEEGQAVGNSVLYFRCDDLLVAHSLAKGEAQVVDSPHLIAKMPDHELWMFFLRDPDGNLIGLMEERH